MRVLFIEINGICVDGPSEVKLLFNRYKVVKVFFSSVKSSRNCESDNIIIKEAESGLKILFSVQGRLNIAR